MFTGHLGALELAGTSIANVGIQGLAYGIMIQRNQENKTHVNTNTLQLVPPNFDSLDNREDNTWSKHNCWIGEGCSGLVYKGFLKDLSSFVAVKKISRNSEQGIKEFVAQVKIISHVETEEPNYP
ncbi:hypothetical protein LWI29_008190 [Acer saccharum]|uniref:Protein kinase domain-containing protein n=1 Tax=Acer saccharum TaxID=4024 RepID=A0AA39VSP1_ACESA|nr:hypothetical protein LWI29_008190 [Acer saccharum]